MTMTSFGDRCHPPAHEPMWWSRPTKHRR